MSEFIFGPCNASHRDHNDSDQSQPSNITHIKIDSFGENDQLVQSFPCLRKLTQENTAPVSL